MSLIPWTISSRSGTTATSRDSKIFRQRRPAQTARWRGPNLSCEKGSCGVLGWYMSSARKHNFYCRRNHAQICDRLGEKIAVDQIALIRTVQENDALRRHFFVPEPIEKHIFLAVESLFKLLAFCHRKLKEDRELFLNAPLAALVG